MNEVAAAGHLELANARETEALHLATTIEQIAEYDMSIKTREAKISSYQDAIAAEREGIRDDKAARAKLRRKKMIFRRAVFDLENVDQG